MCVCPAACVVMISASAMGSRLAMVAEDFFRERRRDDDDVFVSWQQKINDHSMARQEQFCPLATL